MNSNAGTAPITTPFDSVERDLDIMVGFDGSDHARSALHFAAAEALSRKTGLTVVTAYSVPLMIYPNMASLPAQPEDKFRQELAEKTLAEAREYLSNYPGRVDYVTAEGDPAGALVDLSARAKLVVVGARGRGGFVGRILGSVAAALPAHARCPTVVVPSDYQPSEAPGAERFTRSTSDSPVVAAIDGSEQSRVVLLVSAQQAEHRSGKLHIFAAMPLVDEWVYWYPELSIDESTTQTRRTELEKSIEAELSWLRELHPSVEITVEVAVGEPIALIAAKTQSADLTVIGTRGRGAVKSALLGSISRGVLNNAEGVVMVAPTEAKHDKADR